MLDEEKKPTRKSDLSVNLALNKNSRIVPYSEKLDLNFGQHKQTLSKIGKCFYQFYYISMYTRKVLKIV